MPQYNNKLTATFNLPMRFWIVALIAFINAVSFTALIPILYPYAKEFGLSDFQASLLITSYSISQFLATPVLGRCSDFLGRKPLLIVSLLGTVTANVLASFTPIAGLLFAARILDGLTGGNTSIAAAIISDTTTPAERTKAFGLFDAASRLGFMTGPAISYFAQTLPTFPGVLPLGMSFFVAAIISIVATLLTWLLLPETLAERSNFSLSWQLFGFRKIVGAIRRPVLGRMLLLTFFTGFTFTIFAFAFQPFFLNVLDGNARGLAILFTLFGMVGVLTQMFVVGPLSHRFNLIVVLSIALAGRGIVFLLIPGFPVLPIFVLLAVLLSIASAFTLPLINAILSLNSGDREQGEMLGLNSSYLSVSNAIGPAIAGLLVTVNYGAPFWVAGVLTLLTAGFAFSLRSILGGLPRDATKRNH